MGSPQNRSFAAVFGYMADGGGPPVQRPNAVISSPERGFSPKAEDLTLKRPSGFLHEKSGCWSSGAINWFRLRMTGGMNAGVLFLGARFMGFQQKHRQCRGGPNGKLCMPG